MPELDYPFHDKTIVVTRCGSICLGNNKINFSQVFAGQAVGILMVREAESKFCPKSLFWFCWISC